MHHPLPVCLTECESRMPRAACLVCGARHPWNLKLEHPTPCIQTAITSELHCESSVHLCCRVQITVVDVAGRRHQLTALEGQTLVQVLQEHDELLGSDGESLAVLLLQRCCGKCHDRAAVLKTVQQEACSVSLQRAAHPCRIGICCGSCLGLHEWDCCGKRSAWVCSLGRCAEELSEPISLVTGFPLTNQGA